MSFIAAMKVMAKSIHDTAKEKGWWEKPRNPLELQMLMVSELAEACEEARKGTPPVYKEQYEASGISGSMVSCVPGTPGFDEPGKPEGELIELADCVIRIMDYCESRGWDLGEAIEMKVAYNTGRPYRHGGKLY